MAGSSSRIRKLEIKLHQEMGHDHFDLVCGKEPPGTRMLAIAPAQAGRVRRDELRRAPQRAEPVERGRRGVERRILADGVSGQANHGARGDSEPVI